MAETMGYEALTNGGYNGLNDWQSMINILEHAFGFPELLTGSLHMSSSVLVVLGLRPWVGHRNGRYGKSRVPDSVTLHNRIC